MYDWTRDSVNEVRRLNYSYDVLTSQYSSKDIRINTLTNYMREKYLVQWNNWFQSKIELLINSFCYYLSTKEVR